MTYPNVLVMGYLRQAGRLTPEWRMKLEAAINQGYQRLLTFQTSDGGFDWYGQDPGNVMLTAYGLMKFRDMSRVHPIDERLLDRARDFLMESRRQDGTWELGRQAYSWRSLESRPAVTAYVTWALLEAGFEEPRGTAALVEALEGISDPYTLALAANALVVAKSPHARRAIERLEGMAKVSAGAATWGDLETTALAALALARSDASKLSREALTALVRAKDPQGGWASTQATILAIKALLEAAREPKIEGAVPVTVVVNGRAVSVAPITAGDADVVRRVKAGDLMVPGENVVEVSCARGITAQIAGRYWMPWELVEREREASPLRITVAYDKERLTREDKLTSTVTMAYSGPGTFMVIADLGIPPGFAVDPGAFDRMVKAGKLDKYEIAARQITLYFGAFAQGQTETFAYDLRPKFPIEAKTAPARTYEYYNPDRTASARPVTLEVH